MKLFFAASQVHVALQTEFSDRLQHAFEPTCSLFDVLRHWDGEPGRYACIIPSQESLAIHCTGKLMNYQLV